MFLTINYELIIFICDILVRKGGIIQFERTFQIFEPPTVEIIAFNQRKFTRCERLTLYTNPI
jgi:hypothetical protein